MDFLCVLLIEVLIVVECKLLRRLAGYFFVHYWPRWTIGKALSDRTLPASVVLCNWTNIVFFRNLTTESGLTAMVSGSQIICA